MFVLYIIDDVAVGLCDRGFDNLTVYDWTTAKKQLEKQANTGLLCVKNAASSDVKSCFEYYWLVEDFINLNENSN